MVTVSGNTIVIDILPSSRRRGDRLLRAGKQYGHEFRTDDRAVHAHQLLLRNDFRLLSPFLPPRLHHGLFGKDTAETAIKKEPISLDRFFLVKGTWAGISLLLLSIPYGMTTTYVAMYADEIGISVNSGLYFTFMAIGLAVSRMFSGRQVDKAGESRWSSRWGCILPPPASSGWQLWKADAVEFGFHFLSVYRDRPFTRSRIRYDVPGFQHTVREPRSQQPEGDSDFHLSPPVGMWGSGSG